MLTLHDVVRTGTEVRQHFQGPWILLVIALMAIGIMYMTNGCWLSRSGENAPAVQPAPQDTSEQDQQVATAPARVENPPVQTQDTQTEPEVAVPTVPMVVNYQVKWTEVQGFDPFTIPVEEGFYSGDDAWSGSFGNTEDLDPETVFVWRIFPKFEAEGFRHWWVAAVRDGEITFAKLEGTTLKFRKINGEFSSDAPEFAPFFPDSPATEKLRYFVHLILSIDGEKTWCDLVPFILPAIPGPNEGKFVIPTDLRIRLERDIIHLYVEDDRVKISWWEAVVNKSELPCS